VWAVLRWRCRHLISASGGLLVIPMLVLYFAPFVATNTDPRYRVPMDVVLIIDSALCLSILQRGRHLPDGLDPSSIISSLPSFLGGGRISR
jgi:hypothetical protein